MSSTPVREAASISITSTWRSSAIARQLLADAAGIDGRAALAVGPDAVEGAGEDAGGGGLADAAHAGEHEGMGDAAGGDGVGQGAHHRLLADQGGEVDGPVFAREDAIGEGGVRGFFGWLSPCCHPLSAPWPLRPGGRRARAARPPAARATGERVRDWHDPKRIRYGCFLPDLTGLATAPPTPAPRGGYIRVGAPGARGRLRPAPAGRAGLQTRCTILSGSGRPTASSASRGHLAK